MKNWVHNNIVGIFAIAAMIIIALSGAAATQMIMLIRHDERIRYMSEDIKDTRDFFNKMKTDIEEIKRTLIKMAITQNQKGKER